MKKKFLKEIMKIKAAEYNCNAGSFSESENLILVDEQTAFKMITFGKNVVILTNKDLYEGIERLLGNTDGVFCFDAPQLCAVNEVLHEFNFGLGDIYDFFIPSRVDKTTLEINKNLEVKKVNKSEYTLIDNIEQFDNAVCTGDSFKINELAYVAMDRGKVAAVAGASSNTEKLWWVGVDTVEKYRGKGLASYLVNLVARDTLELKKIPVYPTWFSNIGSRTTAINAGFKPGFVEIFASERQRS